MGQEPEVTPIENIVQDVARGSNGGDDCFHAWVKDYMEAMRVLREQRGTVTLVDYHKAKLGKQSKTFRGEFRHWIWETGSWTIFVSNFKGVSFEVPEMSTPNSAIGAWEDYKERMGLSRDSG